MDTRAVMRLAIFIRPERMDTQTVNIDAHINKSMVNQSIKGG